MIILNYIKYKFQQKISDLSFFLNFHLQFLPCLVLSRVNRIFPLEAAIWLAALIGLAFSYPIEENHFTVCPLALAGIENCPGCGLGRSISALLHGEIQLSLQMHWFGIPAFLIICFRIFILLKNFFKTHYGKSN